MAWRYRFAHIGIAMMNLCDIALVARANIQLGIPDKYIMLGGSAMSDTVNQFKYVSYLYYAFFLSFSARFLVLIAFWFRRLMPFLILSGQLCPPGIEGTLFALFMSINNFGNTLGSFFGAALASILGISSGSFHNLQYGLIVQLFCTLIPISFLFLIPKEATGSLSHWLRVLTFFSPFSFFHYFLGVITSRLHSRRHSKDITSYPDKHTKDMHRKDIANT